MKAKGSIASYPSLQQGFTLVELAIVLVIIGLIIGGVLVGQDMIKGAEVRATAGQLEKYNTAVNTFRDKFRYIPGDMTSSAAVNFGYITRTGTRGHGDGNSLIEGAAAGATVWNGEVLLFWRDLNQAGMIDGNTNVGTDAAIADTTNQDTISNYAPRARLGRGNFISIYSTAGYNYYQVTGISGTTSGAPTLTMNLTPQESFNIDAKLDDGLPLTGNTVARGGTSLNTAATSGASTTATPDITVCITSSVTPNAYNTVTSTAQGTALCSLRARVN